MAGEDSVDLKCMEDISMVAKRFFYNGMAVEQVAERMDVPVNYVEECLKC